MEQMNVCAGGYRGESDRWLDRCNDIHAKNGPYPSDNWVKITPECIAAAFAFTRFPSQATAASMAMACYSTEFTDCTGSKDYAERQEAFKCFDNPDNYG